MDVIRHTVNEPERRPFVEPVCKKAISQREVQQPLSHSANGVSKELLSVSHMYSLNEHPLNELFVPPTVASIHSLTSS